MTEKKNDARSKGDTANDTEAGLQNELSREETEGTDSIGDIASNRTLSGSSSWETLPDDAAGGGRASKSGKESSQAPSTPSGKNKSR